VEDGLGAGYMINMENFIDVTNAIVIKSNVVTALQKYILFLLQVHSKGLKFGLYVDLGNETCGGYPGSLGYYATDSVTLSEWGVDFVKVGACGIKDVQSCNNGKHCTFTIIIYNHGSYLTNVLFIVCGIILVISVKNLHFKFGLSWF